MLGWVFFFSFFTTIFAPTIRKTYMKTCAVLKEGNYYIK